MVQWTVFLISFWGDQIGQKVKKICDWWVNLCTSWTLFFIYFHTAVSVEAVEYLWIFPSSQLPHTNICIP